MIDLHRSARVVMLLLMSAAIAACAQVPPRHNIPVRQEFIHAGVQIGDTVDIAMRNGDRKSFVVQSIGADRIHGDGETILFSDIDTLVVRSWSKPGNPCGGEKPAACDIPAVVRLFSDEADDYADRFHSACVTHDYCYGHGLATYGATRKACDDIFYDDMKKECAGIAGLGVVDLEDFAACQLAAGQAYAAVRKYGEKYYLSATSTRCEYRLID